MPEEKRCLWVAWLSARGISLRTLRESDARRLAHCAGANSSIPVIFATRSRVNTPLRYSNGFVPCRRQLAVRLKKDRRPIPGFGMPYEMPVPAAKGAGPDRVFHEMGIDLDPSIAEKPAGEGPSEAEPGSESNGKQRAYTVADLVAGDILTVPEGHELKQASTPAAPANNIEVISDLAGRFDTGMGLPPAFFLDEKLTGLHQRAVNGKASSSSTAASRLLPGWGARRGNV